MRYETRDTAHGKAGSGKRLPDRFEVVAVAFEVFERDPLSFSIDHHRSTLGCPFLPRIVGAVLRKMQCGGVISSTNRFGFTCRRRIRLCWLVHMFLFEIA